MIRVLRRKKIIIYAVLIVGILLVLLGIILVILSFREERLDDGYKITKVTSYTSEYESLESGEINVAKNVSYQKDAVYKITYKNYYKKIKNKSLIEKDTSFSIVDILGDSYELLNSEIIINNKSYKLTSSENTFKDIYIVYDNNTINISLPNTYIDKDNTIEYKIKLNGRDTNKKYKTSRECYFTFMPSTENDFYSKKDFQSYVIEGIGYIELSK